MGYQVNTQAYELFIQLEVGLREFLIQSIRSLGVYEWTNNFLGNIQRETINEVVKRINEAYRNQKPPEPADQYFYKLNRAKKEIGFKTLKLFHPFYYLNWTDLEGIMRMKNNASLIDKLIGKLNRETIIEILKPLNHLRNDVAHSRFITDENYKFIKASYDKITVLIPNFQGLINSQSSEQTVAILFEKLKNSILKIEAGNILTIKEIEVIDTDFFECENSFWLNSENLELVKLIKEFRLNLNVYRALRGKQGGLLEIQKLKPVLTNSIFKIKNLVYG
jgi:hypothetical protein